MDIAIGIDIGGTNTVFGIVDKTGKIYAEGIIKTKGYSVNNYIELLSSEIKKLLDTLKVNYTLTGIGIGAPNGNFYKGTIDEAPNLEWKGTIHLADIIQKQFAVPAWLTNDANAAALGEMIYGGAQNMKDFLFITLGTGLGSGIVSNGKLIYGHDGFAGELGHTIVVENGRRCGCGRNGCLETYASATGIKRTAEELLKKDVSHSVLQQYSKEKLDSKLIYEAAKKGDNLALECFDFTVDILGKALANAVAYTNPEAIFIFGGLAMAEDLLLKPLKIKMEENLLYIYKNKIKILPSQLKNGEVAILGASALVWSEK
ncbi:MAG: ROK family protein [Chlorobi bacterium]|nr:ROK family protein [Chlorobiota bacterium]